MSRTCDRLQKCQPANITSTGAPRSSQSPACRWLTSTSFSLPPYQWLVPLPRCASKRRPLLCKVVGVATWPWQDAVYKATSQQANFNPWRGWHSSRPSWDLDGTLGNRHSLESVKFFSYHGFYQPKPPQLQVNPQEFSIMAVQASDVHKL